MIMITVCLLLFTICDFTLIKLSFPMWPSLVKEQNDIKKKSIVLVAFF